MTEQNKTRPTGASPGQFMAAVEPAVRRADGEALLGLFADWTGWPARMWGPSIVGYGRYHYRYESGREGEFLVTGFSPRKAALSIYIMPGYRDLSEPLARLGKHRTGKSCLYVTRLANVDVGVLEEIVREGVEYMRANYRVWPA